VDPTLAYWLKKSTLRFMRTPGPSLATRAQSSWSLLSNTLGGRIASLFNSKTDGLLDLPSPKHTHQFKKKNYHRGIIHQCIVSAPP